MKKCLYRFYSGTQKSQGICPLPVGISLPAVPPTSPFIPPFVGQSKPVTSWPGDHGFTLIEIMTVLVVATVLITIAVPNIGSFIQNNRMVTQTNDLLADLNFARSETIKRSTSVTICKSSNPTASSPTCSTAGNDWAIGRIIFIDPNSNGAADGGEIILRAREPLDGGNTLRAGANLINFLIFTRSGITTLTAAAARENEFALCDSRGPAQGRSVRLEITGRATIAKNPADCSPP
jgi:type IV fimbrial biogenesis protein FimT